MISDQDKIVITSVETPLPAIPTRPVLRRRWPGVLVWFGIFALSLGGLTGTALADLFFNYGVTYGVQQPRFEHVSPAQLGAHPVGVNSFLHHEGLNSPEIDRSLDMMKAGGFGFVRQQMPWEEVEQTEGVYNWAKFDALVDKAGARGLQVLLRLDRPPTWSRLGYMESLSLENKREFTGPPDNLENFYNFVGKVAERYKGRVKYYQLWNEPNLVREWNGRPVDAAAYVELLRQAYGRIKAADPQAVIVSAPLSPTADTDPAYALNDLIYLDQMYRAGAKDYFDVLALQIYGLGYGPDFRYIQPDFSTKDLKRINFNRPASIREVMIKNGDGAKPAWATEYGWVSVPPQWSESYRKNLNWGESVNERLQAEYLVQGLERIRREWPWIGLVNVWFFRPDLALVEAPENPTNYFTIVQRDFQPRPAYSALQNYNLNKSSLAYSGWHPATGNPSVKTVGQTLRFQFSGERLELFTKGAGAFEVKLDDKEVRRFQAASNGPVTIGENLSDGPHLLEVRGLESGLAMGQVEGFYVSRYNHWALFIVVALALSGVGVLVSGTRLVMLGSAAVSRFVPLAGRGLRKGYRNFWPRRTAWTPYAMVVALLLFYFAPMPLPLLGAGLFFLFCFVRPDWAVGLVALTSPLLMHPRNLRPGGRLEFTLAEVIIVELLAASVVLGGWHTARLMSEQPKGASLPALIRSTFAIALRWLRRNWLLAVPLALLFVLATASLLVPPSYHLKEALREYRLVVAEPLALFALTLVYITKKGTTGVARLVDFLVLAGVAVSLVGIYQFLFPARPAASSELIRATQVGCTVATEGVIRVCSVYTHPDNFGLFLGRIIPLAAGLVIFTGQSWRLWLSGRRRWMYGLALLPLGVALVLSFSRGAWIGVAVALLAMLLAGSAWRLLLAYGGVLLLGLVALPFIRVERITNLFNLETGSSGTRIYLWQSSLEMIKDHPFTGLGLDQFLYNYNPQYVHPLAWTERFTSHPHNLLLDFWLRLGVFGPFLLGFLLFAFFKTALSARLRKTTLVEEVTSVSKERATLRRALTLGLFGSMVDFLVHGLFDNSYFVMDLAIIFCLSFAMLAILRREAQAEFEAGR